MQRVNLSLRRSGTPAAVVLTVLANAAIVQNASAQGSLAETDTWDFTLAPYLLFPHMNGQTGIGDALADVDVGPGDIFERLDFGAMLFLELANRDWSVSFDGLYMNLGESGMTPVTGRDVEVDLKQSGLQLTALRRIASWAEIGLGARLNTLDASIEVAPGEILPGTEALNTETWFDPLIATRLTVPDAGKWDLGLRGDVGGFGVGSSFAWQVVPFAGYRFSRLFELLVMYRALGMDYESGSDSTLFVYDMRIFGPQVGLVFRF